MYILLLVVFAVAYSLLPNGFYHSNIQHESAFLRDGAKLSELLRRDILRVGPESVQAGVFECTPYKVDSVAVPADSLHISDGVLYFDVSLNLLRPPGRFHATPLIGVQLIINTLTHPPDRYLPVKSYGSRFRSRLVRDDSLLALPPSVREQVLEKLFGPAGGAPYLYLGARTEQELIEYSRGAAGLGYFVSGNLPRMLYLSAATITTLGFGDIAPVSRLARGLVGLEAVLGVIVVGLFMTSIARRLRPNTVSEGVPRGNR